MLEKEGLQVVGLMFEGLGLYVFLGGFRVWAEGLFGLSGLGPD